MTDSKTTRVNCPSCGKSVPWIVSQVYKPFCSERCKLIDLGEWVNEENKIPGNTLLEDSPQN